jgi:NAD+ kinase
VDKPPASSSNSNHWAFPPGHAPALYRIGVLHHPKIARSQRLADDIAVALTQLHAHVWIGSTRDEEGIRTHIADLNLLVTLGGDGSMLRAARVSAPFGVPIFGINLGRLGFLAEVRPDEWQEFLPRVVSGGYRIEERTLLRAEARRGNALLATHDALNDVVVSRGSLAHVVRVKAQIDGHPLTQYVADGLIVATATGSTAYALAAGGPILPPTLTNMVLVPIAPHLSMDRALVLDSTSTVEMLVTTEDQVLLTLDGQFNLPLLDGDSVTVRVSPHLVRFVRVQPPVYFYRTLMARLRPGANSES